MPKVRPAESAQRAIEVRAERCRGLAGRGRPGPDHHPGTRGQRCEPRGHQVPQLPAHPVSRYRVTHLLADDEPGLVSIAGGIEVDYYGRPAGAGAAAHHLIEIRPAAESSRLGQHNGNQIRRRGRRGPCCAAGPELPGPRGSACGAGNRGSSRGGDCSAGTCAYSRRISITDAGCLRRVCLLKALAAPGARQRERRTLPNSSRAHHSSRVPATVPRYGPERSQVKPVAGAIGGRL